MGRERSSYTRKTNLRDPSLILVACEGAVTEREYLGIISKSLGNSQRSKLKIELIGRPSHLSAPKHVMGSLLEYAKKHKSSLQKGDVLCIVIDTDSWQEKDLSEIARQCNQADIVFAVSNPCFEVWILSHFREILSLNDTDPIGKKELRTLIRESIGKDEKDLNEIQSDLKQHIERAIKNSKDADAIVTQRWPENKTSRFYLLAEIIIQNF